MKTSSSRIGRLVGTAEGHPPVGVLVDGAGLVLRTPVAHRVGQRDAPQPRRRPRQVGVQRLDRRLDVGTVALEQPDPAELAQPGLALDRVDGELLLDRAGQQSQRRAQPDVVAREVARRRRQVVGRHRRQAPLPPSLSGERAAVAVVVALEPQDRGAEDAALGEIGAHPRLDGAQVLADDDRVGPVRLQREDADQRLVVVAHIGAGGGVGALRDPPQPEQPDDVVDPQPAGVAQRRRDQPAEGLVRRVGEAVGTPGRLLPVLAVLVVGVGWRADRDPAGVRLLQRPRVGPAPVDADGEVGHHAQAHARRGAAPAGSRPAARRAPTAASGGTHGVGVLLAEGRHARAGPGCFSSRRPRRASRRRAPRRSRPRWRSRRGRDPRGGGSPRRRARRPADRGDLEDLAQRGPLGGPRGVAVDAVGHRVAGLARAARAATARSAGARAAYSGIRSGRR